MADRATAKVTELYVTENQTFITLDLPAETAPVNRQFELLMSDPNYNAMYSLALAAAANRWPLTIRVKGGDVQAADGVRIEYVTVNWAGTAG
jgi:hypothetical protein